MGGFNTTLNSLILAALCAGCRGNWGCEGVQGVREIGDMRKASARKMAINGDKSE